MGHLSAPLGLDPDTHCAGLGIGSFDGEPLVTPLVQSTTFCRDTVGSNAPHQYSRVSNPTVAALERALGALENAPPAVAFTTGLAAETALFLALVKSGDHVVCGRTVYGGTTRLLQQLLPGLGISASFIDSTDPDEVGLAIRPNTRLVFIETPANPTLDITDIRRVADITHAAGALLAVDNTFLTPILQQPLDLGADIAVYSTTKFIEGHSVALGGSLVSRDLALLERFRFIRKCTGAIQTPFNAWLTLNGLKTLPLRLRRQSETAEVIARWLADRDEISRVYYPCVSESKNRSLIERQHLGLHGAVISFELTGGIESARRFAEALKRCALVEHVGSVSTLITHPASMTHADVSVDERLDVGITDGLLRLSVGLESPGAIIADLEQALASVHAGRPEVLTCANNL